MIFPDDLPEVIDYRLGKEETFKAKEGSTGEWKWRTRYPCVISTYPRRPVATVSRQASRTPTSSTP